jgi:hypothetical protein
MAAVVLGSSLAGAGEVTLQEAVDGPWEWTTSETSPFIGYEVAEAKEGGDLARGLFGQFGETFSIWMETTVEGPGVFRIYVRTSGDPYITASMEVDGVEAERWIPGFQPDLIDPTGWRAFTAPILPGSHTVRVGGCFGCDDIGAQLIENPGLEFDHAELLPLNPAFGPAMNAPNQQWYSGGDVFVTAGEDAHDEISALGIGNTPGSNWVATAIEGPATATWWSRGSLHLSIDNLPVANEQTGDWVQERYFIPPGENVIRWTQNFLDEFSSQPATPVGLHEALDTAHAFIQGGGGVWTGIATPAASDGEDMAFLEFQEGDDPTWLETTIEGPAALEYNFVSRGDLQLTVTDNGVPIDGGHGLSRRERPDTHQSILPTGTHRIRFETVGSSYPFSDHALLTMDQFVVTPLQSVSLADALDAPNLSWTTGGDFIWSGVTSTVAPDGQDAVVSPSLTEGQSAWLETTVTGPGTFSFRWVPGYQQYQDRRWKFLLDGEVMTWVNERTSAAVDPRFIELGPGAHTIRWEVEGPAAGSALLLDQVSWTPSAQPPLSAALDTQAFKSNWQNIGWTVSPDGGIDGGDALRFGLPGAFGHLTDLTLHVRGPALVSFYAKTGPNCSLQYRANGVPPEYVTPGNTWTQYTIQIPPGERRLHLIPGYWYAEVNPQNTVWIDQLSITPNDLSPRNVLPSTGPRSNWTTSAANPWVGIDRPGLSNVVAAGRNLDGEVSWLESTVAGPAVVKFLAKGQGSSTFNPGLRVLVNGREKQTVSSSGHDWVVLYFPTGNHNLRLETVDEPLRLNPEITAFTYARMSGEPSIRIVDDYLELRVPRPAGYRDDQIEMRLSERINSLSYRWARAPNATVFESTAGLLVLRYDLNLYPVRPEKLFAAAGFLP